MHFLETNQIEEWLAERAVSRDALGTPQLKGARLVLRRSFGPSASPPGQEEAAANACADAVGKWTECLLWIQNWGIWPSSENWPVYYAARGEQGERRSLEDARGHLFGEDEVELFRRFLKLALENGWDAHAVARQNEAVTRVHVDHDEYLEVWAC